MSLDRRLRDELQRDADRIVPDVERNLGAVEAHARQRRSSVGGPMLLAAVAVIAIAIVLRVETKAPLPAGASSSPGPAPVGSPGPSATPTYDAIAGTYALSIDPADPAASAGNLGGTWTMRLLPDGEMLLSTPATFAYGSISPSGIAFSLVGDRFRTNLFYNDFCNTVGTYTWSLSGGSLSFAPVSETCPIRQTLLSTMLWQRAP